MKARSSSADRFAGSATATVTEPSVRPIGTTQYLRAIRAGISLMMSAAIFLGNATSGMPNWRERKWTSWSSVMSPRRTMISPSFSPVRLCSVSARSNCFCVTTPSETSRSPKRRPIGAWLALRSAVVAAVALGSWPSPRPVSSGPTASCRCPVLIVFRGSSHPPQAQCQPRAVFRIEEKQEFSQWYRAAIDGLRRLVSLQSGQFLFC